MKNKLYLYAITFVIAGLLLSGVSGRFATQEMTANESTIEASDIEDLVSYIKECGPGGLEGFEKVDFAANTDGSAAAQIQREQLAAETVYAPLQEAAIEPQAVPSFHETRQPYLVKAQHPCLGSAPWENGNLVMSYELVYQDLSDPDQDLDALVYTGSSDYGSDGFGGLMYFIDINTQEPIQDTYPEICYWGMNGTNDRYEMTFVPEDNNGDTHLLTIETDDAYDLINGSFRHVYWAWSTHGFLNVAVPEIDCDNRYGDWYWGGQAFAISESGEPNKPGYLVQEAENGSAWLITFSLTNVQGCDITIDNAGTHTHCCWDPNYLDPLRKGFLTMWTNSTDHNDYEAWIWYGDHYSFEYPSTAVNDKHILMAMEAWNVTSGGDVEMLIVRFENDTTSDIVAETGWYVPAGGDIGKPEMAHVEGDTFICTAIYQNHSDPADKAMVFAVTYDGGFNWDGLYLWSGDETVIYDYKAIELDHKGSMAVREYDAAGGDLLPGSINLYYSYVTCKLDGYVEYEEAIPVDPCSVTVENTDPDYGFIRDAYTDGNYYWKTLILGFDIWTNATFEMTGYDEPCRAYMGTTSYQFEDIYLINTHNITVYPRLVGDLNSDCIVDLADLAALLAHYKDTGVQWEDGDLNCDDIVNLADLAALLAHYKDTCE